jgi:hypothetical protein
VLTISPVASLLDHSLRDLIDLLSISNTLNLIFYKVRDSKLYISFSIES